MATTAGTSSPEVAWVIPGNVTTNSIGGEDMSFVGHEIDLAPTASVGSAEKALVTASWISLGDKRLATSVFNTAER